MPCAVCLSIACDFVISCHTHLLFDENIFDLTLVCYGDLRHTGLNQIRTIYTTLTNFSTKYLAMCKVYSDVGGIK